MDRLRDWSRPFLRELPHGTAYLGLMMIVIIGLVMEGLFFRTLEQRTVRKWGMSRSS